MTTHCSAPDLGALQIANASVKICAQFRVPGPPAVAALQALAVCSSAPTCIGTWASRIMPVAAWQLMYSWY